MKIFHKALAFCMSGVMLLSLASCGSSSKELKLGTGGTGGNYYTYGNVYASIVEANTDYTVTVKTTAGSAANLRLLNEGFLDMAIVQSDTLLNAMTGQDAFAEKALTGYSAVAGLYTESCQVIVPADSDIESISDLSGKRVSIGEEDSGVVRNAELILQASGLSTDLLEVSYLSFADSAAAMQNGELDAFFVTAGAPTTAVTELSQETDIRILSLDEETISLITENYGGYCESVIPAGTYTGQDEDVTTLGVRAVLVARDKLSSETVEELTALLFDNASEFRYGTSAGIAEDPVEATANIPVTFHPGAAAWYEAQGVTVATGAAGKTTYGVTGAQDE